MTLFILDTASDGARSWGSRTVRKPTSGGLRREKFKLGLSPKPESRRKKTFLMFFSMLSLLLSPTSPCDRLSPLHPLHHGHASRQHLRPPSDGAESYDLDTSALAALDKFRAEKAAGDASLLKYTQSSSRKTKKKSKRTADEKTALTPKRKLKRKPRRKRRCWPRLRRLPIWSG